jgi:cytochrome c oxidase assembly protein subunit 15
MNNSNSQALLSYRKMAVITLAAVYFLILVGATVRASGSGMGCPDWPTCFGQWVPPTSEAQLPADYQQVYAELGYSDTQFNVVKTWTEYLNRVLGVSIGFMIFITAILSWRTRRMITVHMLVALAIVATLLFALAQARRELMEAQPVHSIDPKFERWLAIVLVMTVVQVAMGTQVREMTDFIKEAQGEELRSSWIEAMPWFFYVHRSFSAVVLFSNLWLVRILINSIGWQHTLTRLCIAMIGVIVLSVVSGATLGHLGMPALVQPTHLLAASLLFGLQFLIWMSYRHSKFGSTGRFESKVSVSQPGLNASSASA